MITEQRVEQNRRGSVIFGLALLSSLATVVLLWRTQNLIDNRPDPYWFSAMGKSLAHGEGFAAYGSLLHRRAPLYPLMIAAIYKLFGEHDVLVQLVQCLLFAGTAVSAYDIGRRVYNQRTGVIVGVLCALHPSLLRYVPDFHLETLLTFLLTLMVWLTVRFVEEPTVRRGALFGLVAGLATLTKAVGLLYPALFVGVWLWTRRKNADRGVIPIAAIGAIFVTMGLTILPWTIRNYRATGAFVLVSSGSSDAFLRGLIFSKYEYATLKQPPYTDAENETNATFRAICAAQGVVWEKDDLETDRILSVAAKQRALADPTAVVRKFFVGLFTFWYEMTSLKNSLFAGLLALGGFVFAGIGLKRSWHEGQRAWLVALPIVYLNLLLAALLALGRYSIPVTPCLMVLAGFGMDTLLARRAASSLPEGTVA